ncbi:MAG: MBL fold metallo-hydrolase [Actinomycetota bacterium]
MSGVGRGPWRVGAVTIDRVEENIVPLPTKVLVPDITQDQLDAAAGWIEPYFDPPEGGQPILRLSLHSFVVRSAGLIIVVDTCVGPDSSRGLQGDPAFVDRLAAAIDGGLERVDVVVCTHVHFDHVGWNTREVDGRLLPTFPAARYLITRAEMEELARDDHMAVREPSIAPLEAAGVLDVVDVGDDGHPITDEVRLIPTPGHTPGHVSVAVESAGASALITGDAFHNPIQIANPELAAWRFDADPEASRATRRDLVERLIDTETLVLGTHFAPPTGGLIRSGAGGPWFAPADRT